MAKIHSSTSRHKPPRGSRRFSKIIQEQDGLYVIHRPLKAEELIEVAKYVISKKFYQGVTITKTKLCKDYLVTELSCYKHEVFGVLFLDLKYHVIAFEKLFNGSISHALVHPRVILQKALQYNAAAIVLVHNHPSGDPKPSNRDIEITEELQQILRLIDVKLLDHIIVGGSTVLSFVEKHLLYV